MRENRAAAGERERAPRHGRVEPRSEAAAVGLDAPVGTSDVTSSATTCPNCTFEPRVYTRTTGTPVTNVIEFEGNPAGA